MHGLEQIKKHGEDASLDNNIVAIAIPQLRKVLKEYNLKNIYNMDKTGLFYCLEPDTTLATTCLKGKSPNPQCFKRIKYNRLSVTYESSSKAWMMTVLFQVWLKEFDMKMANHKVILLVNNVKCYSSSNLNLHNTTVYYLSPNTTSRIQPLDAGIIMSFKCCYKNYFIKWMLNQYESGNDDKLNVLNAIKFIVQAWNE
ncbi:1414_t:CDS:2, partial [Dentiscutata erythropus]